MDIVLNFEIVMQSDYHVGSGQRGGPLIDSALLRDFDGVPALRGTTLAGLVRDGFCDLREHLEVVAPTQLTAIDGAKQRLFGDATKRKRWTFSSARPLQGEAKKDAQWGAQAATRVRISPRTRRVEGQKLFSEEEGAAKLTFHFSVTRHNANADDVRDAYLLIAAVRMVRHLGSARRRGRGECVIQLNGVQGLGALKNEKTLLDDALTQFKTLWLDSAATPIEGIRVISDGTLSTNGTRKRYRLIGYAVEPILLARRSEAGNAYESLGAIAGSALLGAIAARATDALDLGDPNTLRDFVTLFFRGGLRVTGMYPAKHDDGNLKISVPTPKTLLTCENFPADRANGKRHPFFNLAAQEIDECSECKGALQDHAGFTALERYARRVEPTQREEAHIRINRANERVKTGDLYEYIALDAGQWFVGEIEAANEKCWTLAREWANWTDDAKFVVRVGKATQRGYGALKLRLEALSETSAPTWTQVNLSERVNVLSETDDVKLTLLLLTDAIVTDAWGRTYAGFDAEWIAASLGTSPPAIRLQENVARGKSIDSFNSTRRMPRWRDQALEAGSAAGFTLTREGVDEIFQQWRAHPNRPANEPDSRLDALRWRLNEIERAGIGLRTHEGFGRVAFNHPLAPPHEAQFEARAELGNKFLALAGWWEKFVEPASMHRLQEMERFLERWQTQLDSSTQDKRWEKVDGAFESVARLLFLNASQPIQTILPWLEQMKTGDPQYLWANDANGGAQRQGRFKGMVRSGEDKVNGDGIELVEGLLERLENDSKGDADRQREGINLLAAKVSVIAKSNEANKK